MVASSHNVALGKSDNRGDVSCSIGINDMILIHDRTSRNRSDSTTAAHLDASKVSLPTNKMMGSEVTQMVVQRELKRPTHNDRNSHLRRVRSDNLAQSKRDDPAIRRSIFGDYFNEKPRSYSAPHLVRRRPLPHTPSSACPKSKSCDPRQWSKETIKRKSSSEYSSKTKQDKLENNEIQHRNRSRRHHQHEHQVDYRLFAPSEKQAASSAICSRYRKLNRDHEQEYNSVLERQVRIEHSLPPFPSPLIRFCSETTATVAENEFHAWPSNESALTSSEREIHYHGVYTLLTPVSILKRSRYNSEAPVDTIETIVSHRALHTTSNIKRDANAHSESDEEPPHMSSSFKESLNFPRSYSRDSSILQNLISTQNSDLSDSINHSEEEKKETEAVLSSKGHSAPFLPSEFMTAENLESDGSRAITSALNYVVKESDSNSNTENQLIATSLHHQRIRFDPRVTVTEFEDPVPRKWYQEDELNQHKQQAIALAQCYLRKHPSVAEWYRRATLDPVTNKYRKRALYSLPVFSSTYASTDAEPRLQDKNVVKDLKWTKSLERRLVQKIMIVDPNPAILLLLRKSMKSMFPTADILTSQSYVHAAQIVEESYACESKGFDIMIIQQQSSCRRKIDERNQKSYSDCHLGRIFELLRITRTEPKDAVISSEHNSSHDGSELIHRVCQLSSAKSPDATHSSCLLIGISIRPERDASMMRRAGADIVWGIPIPTVGEGLRKALLSRLHDKRTKNGNSC